MKKYTIYQMLVLSLIPILILITAISSLAWFQTSRDNLIDTHISQGTVIQQYFHCGEGTEENPFVITRPIHYYHLCELYQRGPNDFYNKDYCFQLGYDLDGDPSTYEVYNYDNYGTTDGSYSTTLNMAYYSGEFALIPVGTSTKPFNGTFDGKGIKVTNLSIISSEEIKTSSSTTTYNTCDVGIFGYVGPDAKIKDSYFDNVTIDLTGSTLDATCIGTNTTSHDSDNDGNNDTIYVGYLIGHLYQFNNASGLDYTVGSVLVNASPITNVYVNNITVLGGNTTKASSGYGYIGYVDLLDGETATTISTYYDSVDHDSEGTEGWGGSVDMTALFNRITSIEAIADDNSSTRRYYAATETIVAGESKSDIPIVTVNTRSTSYINSSSSHDDIFYWSASTHAASTDLTGGTYIGSRSSDWNYLYGLSSSQLTSTTTYTKTGAIVDAFYIYDNGAYLSYKDKTISGQVQARNSSKWIEEDKDASGAYYFTYIYNEKYYLNAANTTSISISTTRSTKWICNESGEFYCTISNNPYYLFYNGSWNLSQSVTKYYISDSETNPHYLAATTAGYFTESDMASAAMWEMSNPTGNSTTFYFQSGSTNYYLGFSNGLAITTTATTWKKEVVTIDNVEHTHYYYEVNNVKYYLIYDNGWKAALTDGYNIYDGTHYLGINSSNAVFDTSESNAAMFQITNKGNGNYTIIYVVNGVGKYLSSNGVTLTLSDSEVLWNKDSQGRYYRNLTINGVGSQKAYYLMYNGTWKLGLLEGYKITFNNNYFIGLNNKTITNTTSSDAILWQMNTSAASTTIYTVIDNDAYFLSINANGLALSNTSSTWYKDGSAYYIKANQISSTDYDDLYLTYMDGWTVTVKNGSKIHDNNGHYITNTNAAITSTDEDHAIVWQIKEVSSKYIIYTIVGTTRYYLGVTNNTLARTTTRFEWVHTADDGADQFYFTDSEDIKHYLYYQSQNDTGWTLMVIEAQVKLYYKKSATGTAYYLHTTGTGLTYTTNPDTACNWVLGTNTVYTYIGSTRYYLSYEVVTKKVTHMDGESTIVDDAYPMLIPSVTTTKVNVYTSTSGDNIRRYVKIVDTRYYLVFNTTTKNWEFLENNAFSIGGNNNQYLIVNSDVSNLQTTPTFSAPYLTISSSNSSHYHLFKHTVTSSVEKYTYNTATSTNTYEQATFYTLIGDTVYYLHHSADLNNDIQLTFSTTKYNTSKTSDVDKFYILNNQIYVICNGIRYEISSTDIYTDIYAVPIGLNSFEFGTKFITYTSDKKLASAEIGYNNFAQYQWMVDDLGSGSMNIYISLNGTNYYIFSDNSGNVSLMPTPQTWMFNSDGQLYTIINGIAFYLNCDSNGANWKAEPKNYYTIKCVYNNQNYYLSGSGSTIGAVNEISANCMWFKDGDKLYTYVNGVKKYLSYASIYSGFALNDTGTTNIVFETIGTSIYNLYFDVGVGYPFYLCYDASGWNVNMQGGRTISKDGNYFCFNGTGIYNATAENVATRWHISDSGGEMACYYNGKQYRAYYNNNSISWTIGSSFTSWNVTNGTIYTGSGINAICLKYDGTWKFAKTLNVHIAYNTGSGNQYMTVNGTSISSSTNVTDAATFTFASTSGGIITTTTTSGTRYLSGTIGGISLSTSNSSASWSFSSGKLSRSLNFGFWTDTYCLGYGSGWTFTSTHNSNIVLYPSEKLTFSFLDPLKTQATYTDVSPEPIDTNYMDESSLDPGTTFTAKTNVSISLKGSYYTTDIDGITANVYFTAATFNFASTIYGVSSSLMKEVDKTLDKTAIITHSEDVNPTVNIINTTDQLYVSTTQNYKRGNYLALQLETQDEAAGSTNYYSDYRASKKNTGYIVGGNYSSASGSGIGDIRVSAYGISNISSSYSSGNFKTIYTFNDSGTSPVAINDSVNTYTQYATSKANFLTILKKDNSDVYGLHFMDAQISTSHIMTAEAVRIQNKTYVNYQLPESCIDFNVYSQGNIVLFAGDYYGGNSCFFSINEVFRDANNNITAIREISEVYTKPGLTQKQYYIYKYTDGTYTNANGTYTGATTLDSSYTSTPIFKTKWLTNPSNGREFDNQYIYYFEMPCNKGEYALGSVSGQDGGYLLYLDIATNGTQGENYNQMGRIGDDLLFTQIDYRSSGTVLNSTFFLTYDAPINSTKENFSITVSYDANNVVYDSEYNVDCTIYTININNTTGQALDLLVVLADNDDDIENDYPFRYRIIYNGVEYKVGDSYNASIGAYYASDSYQLPVA